LAWFGTCSLPLGPGRSDRMPSCSIICRWSSAVVHSFGTPALCEAAATAPRASSQQTDEVDRGLFIGCAFLIEAYPRSLSSNK